MSKKDYTGIIGSELAILLRKGTKIPNRAIKGEENRKFIKPYEQALKMKADRNIGLLSDDLVVLDLDVHSEDVKENGMSNFTRYVNEKFTTDEIHQIKADLESTFAQTTPSGGRHYYYRKPDDFDREDPNLNKNNVGEFLKGVDILTAPNQPRVVYPSTTEVGKYEVIGNYPIKDAPDWLIEMLKIREIPKASSVSGNIKTTGNYEDIRLLRFESMLDAIKDGIPEGERNNTLASYAGTLIGWANHGTITWDTATMIYTKVVDKLISDSRGRFEASEAESVWNSIYRKDTEK